MSVVINLKGLEKKVSNLTRIDMDRIGLKAYELNIDQIQKKRNRDGSRFKSYTKAYAERKGVGIGDVDLVSKAKGISKGAKKKPFGTMLKNYGVKSVSRYKVVIGFSNVWDRQKAEWISTGGVNKSKARPFVGLTDKNRQKLLKFAYKIIMR